MKINSYKQQQYINNLKEQKDIAEKNKNISKPNEEKKNMNSLLNSPDSVEISDNFKQLNSIKSKIESGFYNNQSVLKKVAEKLIHTIDIKT